MHIATSTQFIGSLIPGGSLIRDCAICVVLFAALGWLYSKVCGNWSIRNYKCCSKLLLKTGFDKFATFHMVITVHAVKDLEPGRKFIRVEAGREHFDTTEQQGANAQWEESQKIKVLQGTSAINVKVMKPGTFKDKAGGTVKLRILEDLLGGGKEKDFSKLPTKRWYILLSSKGRGEGSVKLSFLKTGGKDGDAAASEFGDPNMNPIAQAHLMQAAQALGRGAGSTGTKRVQVFAKACEGYLRKANAWGNFDTKYFKSVRIKTGKWFLCWWADKSQAEKKPPEKPEGQIAIPAITQVMNHPQERHDFILRYKNRDGSVKDLFLQRVDLDRNIWVELLQAFVHELRSENVIKSGGSGSDQAGDDDDIEKGHKKKHKHSASSDSD